MTATAGPTVLLDHAIVLVRSLAAAEAALLDAGFTLGRSGNHPGLGTHNRIVLFEHGPYLELLAVHQPLPANAPYRALLDQSACVLGLALHTADAEAARAAWVAAAIPVDPVATASRPLPGGGEARFSLLRLPPASTPAAFAFYCQHHTPGAVWEAARAHANGARSLAAVRPAAGAAAPHPLLVAERTVGAGCRAAAVVFDEPARNGLAALRLDNGWRLVLGSGGLLAGPAEP